MTRPSDCSTYRSSLLYCFFWVGILRLSRGQSSVGDSNIEYVVEEDRNPSADSTSRSSTVIWNQVRTFSPTNRTTLPTVLPLPVTNITLPTNSATVLLPFPNIFPPTTRTIRPLTLRTSSAATTRPTTIMAVRTTQFSTRTVPQSPRPSPAFLVTQSSLANRLSTSSLREITTRSTGQGQRPETLLRVVLQFENTSADALSPLLTARLTERFRTLCEVILKERVTEVNQPENEDCSPEVRNLNVSGNNLTVVYGFGNRTHFKAVDLLSRLSILSNEQIGGIMNATIIERPAAFFADHESSSYAFVTSVTVASSGVIRSESTSWPLLGAVVGIATVTTVLLAMALIWLILFIYVRCTRKPTKTVPESGAAALQSVVTSVPLVDRGIQTIILPRKVMRPVGPLGLTNEAYQSDGYATPIPRNGQLVSQTSLFESRSIPDRAALRQITPEEKVINRKEWTNNVELEYPRVTQHLAIPSGNDRVKLISVIKTNRVDAAKIQDELLEPAGRERIAIGTRNEFAPRRDEINGGPIGLDENHHHSTVEEIKKEVMMWRRERISRISGQFNQ